MGFWIHPAAASTTADAISPIPSAIAWWKLSLWRWGKWSSSLWGSYAISLFTATKTNAIEICINNGTFDYPTRSWWACRSMAGAPFDRLRVTGCDRTYPSITYAKSNNTQYYVLRGISCHPWFWLSPTSAVRGLGVGNKWRGRFLTRKVGFWQAFLVVISP